MIFWGLSALEGIACLAALLSIPRDPKHGIILGFSAERLGLLVMAAVVTVIFFFLCYHAWKGSTWLVERLESPILHGKGFYPILIFAFILFIAGWAIIFQPVSQIDPKLLPYFNRFYPALAWMTAIGFQGAVYLLICRFGFHPDKSGFQRSFITIFVVTLAVFGGIWIFSAVTGIGIRPDKMGWYEPGAPLLASEVAVGVLAAVILSIIEGKLHLSGRKAVLVDILIPVLLWVAAVGFWMHEPLQVSYFSPEPRAPNYEVYPYSDAAYYSAIAQSVIIGDGYLGGQSVPRPLYIFFLAVTQAVFGPSYDRMILIQTLLLALFPVILYFIGRELKSRTFGILLAGLEIAREVNAIQATPDIQVSNTKLIMSELPTALGIAILILLILIGMRKTKGSRLLIFTAGGVLGGIMLIRTQSIIMTAAAAFCLFFGTSGNFRQRLKPVLIFVLGLLLCITPLLVHNYLTYHKIVLDKFYSDSYWKITYTSPFGIGGDTSSIPTDEVNPPIINPTISSMDINPGGVAYFTTAHFIHNEISSLMILPSSFKLNRLRNTLESPSLWLNWTGRLTAEQASIMILNLLVVTLGIGAAWARFRYAGLLPLFIHLFYSLGDAVTRFSGGRFILPVDWIILIYFGLGILTVITWIAAGLGLTEKQGTPRPPTEGNQVTKPAFPWKKYTAIGALILLVGGLPWLVENVVPKRYSALTSADVQSQLQTAKITPQVQEEIKTLLTSSNGKAIQGRLLYPRYYRTEAGEPGQNWYAYSSLSYRRMGFIIVGNDGITQVVIPLDTVPGSFPNGTDAIVIGCDHGNGIDATALFLPEVHRVIMTDADYSNGCPIEK